MGILERSLLGIGELQPESQFVKTLFYLEVSSREEHTSRKGFLRGQPVA